MISNVVLEYPTGMNCEYKYHSANIYGWKFRWNLNEVTELDYFLILE